jgi:hypothetical protein
MRESERNTPTQTNLKKVTNLVCGEEAYTMLEMFMMHTFLWIKVGKLQPTCQIWPAAILNTNNNIPLLIINL